MRVRSLFVAAALVALASHHAVGGVTPQLKRLDLANTERIIITVVPGEVSLELSNVLPNQKYSISELHEQQLIPALSSDQLPPLSRGRDECDTAYEAARQALGALKEETDVPGFLQGLPAQVADCEPDRIKSIQQEFDASCRRTFHVVVGRNERVVWTISRGEGPDRRSWTVELLTPLKGRWLTTYGIAWVPRQDDLFWSEPTGTAGQFEIRRQHIDRKEPRSLATVFLTYLREDRADKDVTFVLTPGFGAGDDRWVGLLGVGALVGDAVQLSAGFAMYPRKRLGARYREGQVIEENLGEDQLHTSAVGGGWYGALTLRLDKNPFEKRETKESTSSK